MEGLNNTIKQIDARDIYRTLHLARAENVFFSNAHGIFSRIKHMIGCKTRLLPHIIYQNNSKWLSGLDVKVKTVKFLKENIGINIHDLGSGNGILGITKAGAKRGGAKMAV